MKNSFLVLVFLSVFFLIFHTSCFKRIFGCRDEPFTFSRVENNTDKLRLDGYYYEYFPLDALVTIDYIDVIFLNQNGTLFYAPGQYKNEVLNGTINIKVNDLKPFWGIYKISGDNIIIQYWIPMSNGCVKVSEEKGEILNDTTFKITYSRAIRNGETEIENTENRIFRFKQYSPKPDSIVQFIP